MTDPWVAPDTPSAPPPLPAPAAATGRGGARVAMPFRPRVPVPLRPFTVPDILDGGLRAVKLAPRIFIALAAVCVLPVQLVGAFLSRDALREQNPLDAFANGVDGTGPESNVFFIGFDAATVAQLLGSVALAFVAAGVAGVIIRWYLGLEASPADAFRSAFRRPWTLLAAWLLVHLAELGFLILLFVPVIVPITWFAVVTPVVALESVGPIRSLGRSFRLCQRNFGKVLGTWMLVAVVDVLLSGALTAVGVLVADRSWGWIANGALASAAALITVPFVAACATLLYLDLRVRSEGLDLELAANAQFGA